MEYRSTLRALDFKVRFCGCLLQYVSNKDEKKDDCLTAFLIRLDELDTSRLGLKGYFSGFGLSLGLAISLPYLEHKE